MYKLFTDKTELFECNISIEGASLRNSSARLIIESNDVNLLFNGKIDSSGKCQVPVKKLRGLIDENTSGNIKLEVIAEDTYFVPWESDFTVEASKKVMVEVKSQRGDNIIGTYVASNPLSKNKKNKVIKKITEVLVKKK